MLRGILAILKSDLAAQFFGQTSAHIHMAVLYNLSTMAWEVCPYKLSITKKTWKVSQRSQFWHFFTNKMFPAHKSNKIRHKKLPYMSPSDSQYISINWVRSRNNPPVRIWTIPFNLQDVFDVDNLHNKFESDISKIVDFFALSNFWWSFLCFWFHLKTGKWQ